MQHGTGSETAGGELARIGVHRAATRYEGLRVRRIMCTYEQTCSGLSPDCQLNDKDNEGALLYMSFLKVGEEK